MKSFAGKTRGKKNEGRLGELSSHHSLALCFLFFFFFSSIFARALLSERLERLEDKK